MKYSKIYTWSKENPFSCAIRMLGFHSISKKMSDYYKNGNKKLDFTNNISVSLSVYWRNKRDS